MGFSLLSHNSRCRTEGKPKPSEFDVHDDVEVNDLGDGGADPEFLPDLDHMSPQLKGSSESEGAHCVAGLTCLLNFDAFSEEDENQKRAEVKALLGHPSKTPKRLPGTSHASAVLTVIDITAFSTAKSADKIAPTDGQRAGEASATPSARYDVSDAAKQPVLYHDRTVATRYELVPDKVGDGIIQQAQKIWAQKGIPNRNHRRRRLLLKCSQFEA